MTDTYIISEIGINHNGSVELAKKLIDVSVVSGCNAVKFQKRTPEICVPKDEWDKLRDTPWGEMKYIDYKKKIEFEKEEYDEIDRYCKEKGIDWSVSVWDMPSLEFALSYDSIEFIKIPSAMLTNEELIKGVIDSGRKLIISTGMSTQDEVDDALDLIATESYESNSVVMHCNSSYPAAVEELNLNYINILKETGIPVGYSGHEFGLVATFAAVAMGAEYVERHITLDRTMWGTDQLASVEPIGMMKLVKGIRDINLAMGDGHKRVYESEMPSRKKLRGS